MGTPSASPSSSVSSSVSASASATPSASPSLAIADDQVVTVEEARDVLHVSGTDHDMRIDALLDAATLYAQKYQGRKYLTATCVDHFDRWPCVIRPRWVPLIAVTSIRYIDSSGAWQTLDADAYDVDAASEPGRIAEAYGVSWPGLRGDQNGIEVTYTAGYGTSADDVPNDFRTAILLLVYDWFHNPDREGKEPPSVRALLDAERIRGV